MIKPIKQINGQHRLVQWSPCRKQALGLNLHKQLLVRLIGQCKVGVYVMVWGVLHISHELDENWQLRELSQGYRSLHL